MNYDYEKTLALAKNKNQKRRNYLTPSSFSCILDKSIICPSFAAITLGKIDFASATYFSGNSFGQKCVSIKAPTLASFAIIPACLAVK